MQQGMMNQGHQCYVSLSIFSFTVATWEKKHKQNLHEGLKDNELVENGVDVIITLVVLDSKECL